MTVVPPNTGVFYTGFRGTPYESPNLADQKNRKLGEFGRKLVGNHFLFNCYFEYIIRKNERVMFKLCLFDMN